MPPEQLLSEKGVPSPQWDVYALGLVLYEVLAGEHPMGPVREDDNMAAVCNRHLTIRPKPLAEIAPRVPRDLGYVVDRAIDADPARRWSSMVDLGDALRGALQRMLAPQRAIVRNVPLPNRGLAFASTLPLSATTDDFKPREPEPSAPRTNDDATSSAAQPRPHWKTLTLTANEPSTRVAEPVRAEPIEPATVELPTRTGQRPHVASSPPDHEVSNPPMSAPARAPAAPMSPIVLSLAALVLLAAGVSLGFALGQLRAAPSAGAPAPPSAPPSSSATAPHAPCK